MNIRMLIMLSACALVFGGVFGFKWFGSRMMNQYFDHMPVPTVTVSTAKAFKDRWAVTLTAVGTIEAEKGTDVTTEASGIVDGIEFESGDSVAAGEILLTLDRRTDTAELAALEADAVLAEQELARAKNLIGRGAVAESELDRRAAAAAAARANVDAQRARIAQKVIRAPFAGELGIRKADLGDHLSPGTGIVTLQSLDPILVNFKLPQQQLGDIKARQMVGRSLDIMREATEANQGTVIKTMGDEVMSTFPTADDAMNAARRMQERITAALERWEPRIILDRIDVDLGPDPSEISVIIAYRHQLTGESAQLAVSVPIGGA